MPLTPDPPSAASPATADPTASDPAEASAKADFIAQFGPRAEQEPSAEKALGQPTGELQVARSRAETTMRPQPTVALDPEEQDRLTGKRQPGLPLALELFAPALAKHPSAVKHIGATPELLNSAIALDRAITRQTDVGEMYITGGDNGDLLVSSVLEQLIDKMLAAARAAIKDPGTAPALRGGLLSAFGSAFRRDDERRQHNAADALAQASAPYQQQLTSAQAQAAEERVLDAYLTTIKGKR